MLLQEPLLVIVALYGFFVLIIIIVRLDFSITKVFYSLTSHFYTSFFDSLTSKIIILVEPHKKYLLLSSIPVFFTSGCSGAGQAASVGHS